MYEYYGIIVLYRLHVSVLLGHHESMNIHMACEMRVHIYIYRERERERERERLYAHTFRKLLLCWWSGKALHLYSVGSGFKSRQEHWLSWNVRGFPQSLQENAEIVYQFGRDRLPANAFQFIIIQSSRHLRLYSVITPLNSFNFCGLTEHIVHNYGS
jgi:hypothetical protein